MPQRPAQLNQQGLVSLQPAASPTNQFVSPAVRGPAPVSKLTQLASALSQISPQINRVVENRFEADKQRSLLEGQAYVEQNQLDNQQKFLDAVKSGKLGEGDNPWLMLGAKQTAAKLEVSKAAQDLEDDYYKQGFANNPDQTIDGVRSYASQFLKSRFEGRDLDQQAIIGPATDQIIGGIATRYARESQAARAENAEAGAKMELSTIFSNSPMHSPDDPKFSAAVQGFVKDKSRYMPPARINSLMREAGMQAALDRQEPEFFREVMKNVKTPYGDLGSTKDTEATITQLHDEIVKRQVSQVREEKFMQDDADDKITSAVFAGYQSGVRTLTPKDIFAMPISPDAQNRLFQQYNNTLEAKTRKESLDRGLNFEQTKQRIADVAKDAIVTGRPLNYGELNTTRQIATGSGLPIDQITSITTDLNKIGKEPIQGIEDDLYKMQLNHELTPAAVNARMASLPDDRKSYWVNAANQQDRPGLRAASEEASRESEYLYQRVRAGGMKAAGVVTLEDWAKFQPDSYRDFEQRASDAKRSFEQLISPMLLDQSVDPSSLVDRIDAISDRIGSKAGAIPRTKYDLSEPPPQVSAEVAHPPITAAMAAIKNFEAQKNRSLDAIKNATSNDPAIKYFTPEFSQSADYALQNGDRISQPMAQRIEQLEQLPRLWDARVVEHPLDGIEALGRGVSKIAPWIENPDDEATRIRGTVVSTRDQLASDLPVLSKKADAALKQIAESKSAQIPANLVEPIAYADAAQRTYQKLVGLVGYDAAYAKSNFGDTAWHDKPLFSDLNDLKTNAVKAARVFGVSPSNATAFDQFVKTQAAIIAARKTFQKQQ